MSAPPRVAPTGTYNLASVYRALGIRTPSVIPEVEDKIQATISFGEVRTFSPEVIEARGMVNPVNQAAILVGQWIGASLQSLAEGGAVIEIASFSNPATWNLAPAKPFFGVVVPPFSQGGQALQSIVEVTGINGGGFPIGSTFGGSNTTSGGVFDSRLVEGVWVPPGWWMWVILQGTGAGATQGVAWRWREIPEGQGVA